MCIDEAAHRMCPRLHTLCLQHLCQPSMYPSSSFEVGPSPLQVADVVPEKYSVTLVLQVQHILDIANRCCYDLW